MCLNKSDTYSPPNNFQKGTVPHVMKCGTMQKSRQFVCILAAYFCAKHIIYLFLFRVISELFCTFCTVKLGFNLIVEFVVRFIQTMDVTGGRLSLFSKQIFAASLTDDIPLFHMYTSKKYLIFSTKQCNIIYRNRENQDTLAYPLVK